MKDKVQEMIEEYRRNYNRACKVGPDGRFHLVDLKPEDNSYREPPEEFVVVENRKGLTVLPQKEYQKMGVRKKGKLEKAAIRVYRVKRTHDE